MMKIYFYETQSNLNFDFFSPNDVLFSFIAMAVKPSIRMGRVKLLSLSLGQDYIFWLKRQNAALVSCTSSSMHNVAHGAEQEIFEGGAKYFSYVNLPFITCVWFKVHSNVDTFDWIALRQKFLPRIGTTSSCAHSSEMRDSCSMKWPSETLQNFCNRYAFILCNFEVFISRSFHQA